MVRFILVYRVPTPTPLKRRGQLGQGTTAMSSFLPSSVAFQLAPTQRVVEVSCSLGYVFFSIPYPGEGNAERNTFA